MLNQGNEDINQDASSPVEDVPDNLSTLSIGKVSTPPAFSLNIKSNVTNTAILSFIFSLGLSIDFYYFKIYLGKNRSYNHENVYGCDTNIDPVFQQCRLFEIVKFNWFKRSRIFFL